MPESLAFDTETYLFGPGNLAPKPVCASFYDGSQGWFERFENDHNADCAEETIEGILRPGVTVDVANGAYDWAVVSRRMPQLLKRIFEKYERGEVFDVLIAAALDAIAHGRMTEGMLLDREGRPLRVGGDTGPVAKRFSLSNVVWLWLGRADAKAHDEFRLSYGELDALPTEQWPEPARLYPVDDARNTYEAARAMKGRTSVPGAENIGQIGAVYADEVPLLPDCTWQTFQARAAFAMHLGSVWGFRVSGPRLTAVMDKVNKTLEVDTKKFREWGFIKTHDPAQKDLRPAQRSAGYVPPGDDGKENRRTIKREVALAYGADPFGECPKCKGTGKALSEITGKPINCDTCDATGLELPLTVPRTPSDGIATDRDTLDGTGNERLEAWAEAGKNDKMRETYGPWLAQGVDKPINVRSNVLVASGRCSYDGLVQLIPPMARETIEARPGHVFVSVDYPSLELCTLAQVTYWLFGESRMRDVINATRDPGALHTEFGALMAGIGPEKMAAFKVAAEDKASKEYKFRFMAKAANFGFPGGMGPAKLVLAKRKEGLFFCVASGMNEECAPGVMEWRGKTLQKPTCPDCLEIAARLREDWYKAWPEIKPYFDWVSGLPGIEDGHGRITTPGTGFVRGGLTFSAAANHSFQHLGSMAAKHAAWLISKECYTDPTSQLWGTRPLILVHDEIFAETPRVGMLAAGKRIAELMHVGIKTFCPDIEAPEPEPAFMYHWYKRAALLKDKSGKWLDEVWVPRDKQGVEVEWKP